MRGLLVEKEGAISSIVPDEPVAELEMFICLVLTYREAMEPVLEAVNKARNSITKEKTSCRADLCNQAMLKLRRDLDHKIEQRPKPRSS